MKTAASTLALAILLISSRVSAVEIASGQDMDGDIVAGGTESWTFTAAVNSTILVRVGKLTGGTSFSPKLELRGTANEVLETDTGSSDARLSHRVAKAGTYTIIVSDSNTTDAGTYRIRMYAIPGAFIVSAGDEGGELSNGRDHDGVIGLGDMDAWFVQAGATEALLFRVGELSGGSGFTPKIDLYGPDGGLIATDIGNEDARVEHRTATAGIYILVISGNGDGNEGSYRLRHYRIPGAFEVPTGDEGGPLTNGGNHDGVISVGDMDAWTVQANANQTLLFRLGELSGGNAFAPKIVLYGPDGSQIGTDTGGEDARIEHRTATAGVYTAVISGNGDGNNGAYRLRLYRLPAGPGEPIVPAGDQGGPLTNGGDHDGVISVGDMDAWTVLANANQTLLFRVGELTGGSGFTPKIDLYGPDGVQIATDTGGEEARIEHRTVTAGVYSVVISGNSDGNQGSYRLRHYRLPGFTSPPPGIPGGALTNGDSHDGVISVGGMDAWTVRAGANEALLFRIGELSGGTGFTPKIDLYGPDGALVATNTGASGAQITHQTTVAGNYVLVASGNSKGNTGSYRLSLVHVPRAFVVPSDDEGGALTNGFTHSGVLGPGDLDPWTVSAVPGDSLVFLVASTTGGSSLQPSLSIFDPAGQPVATTDSFGPLAYAVLKGGIYTIVASDASTSGAQTGESYTLTMAHVPGSFAVASGDEGGAMTAGTSHAGAFARGDLDIWTFGATAGNQFVVNVVEVTGGTAVSPATRLFGPDGIALANTFGATSASVSHTASTTGLYTAVVFDYSGVGVGTYNISVTGNVSPPAPPEISLQPVGATRTASSAIDLFVTATGTAPVGYQWQLNGVDIPGAISATLRIPSVQQFHAGAYAVVVTGANGGTVRSDVATIGVDPAESTPGRLLNLSTRAQVATGETPILGFVVEDATKRLLMRVNGPGLQQFGVGGFLTDPILTLKPTVAGTVPDVINDNWSANTNAAEIPGVTTTVGAFDLAPGSADSVLLRNVEPGGYTAIGAGVGSLLGVVIVEVYDADDASQSGQLSNVSARALVGTGADVLIPGFVVSNDGPITLLIRAVGPTLGGFGVPGALVDPKIEVFSSSGILFSNDNWGDNATASLTSAVSDQVGAFALSPVSRDAAFVVTLAPGAYTVQISGVGGITGVALFELYLVK